MLDKFMKTLLSTLIRKAINRKFYLQKYLGIIFCHLKYTIFKYYILQIFDYDCQ